MAYNEELDIRMLLERYMEAECSLEEEARLKLQKALEDLDDKIAEEYDKVYWHGLWRRKQK